MLLTQGGNHMETPENESVRRTMIYLTKKLMIGPSVSSLTQSCPSLRDPTNCSTPGFPVNH